MAQLTALDCPLSLALAVLQTLHTIADNLPPASSSDWLQDQQLPNSLYSREHIAFLARIIERASPHDSVQRLISLAISLICKTCTEEKQKQALADAGVLTALSTRLATFVVLQGFVLPGAENQNQDSGLPTRLPPSAPPNARLAPTLQAIAMLVENSKPRAEMILSSPAIVKVFPKTKSEISPIDVKKTPWATSTHLAGGVVTRNSTANAIDSLLPSVPSTSTKLSIEQLNFPPLGSGRPVSKKRHSFHSPSFPIEMDLQNSLLEEDESPVVAWLIYLVRAETGWCRLMAAKLLVALFALRLTRKSRSSMFCMLLVPLLIKMIDRDSDTPGSSETAEPAVLPLRLRIQEEAPIILATLIMDNAKLQKAAADCNAIKKLSHMLKETFTPLPGHGSGMWCPERVTNTQHNLPEIEMNRIERAPSPLARHTMKLREGLLQALACIAPFDDDYKRAICDQGVVPYIIDSLKPYSAGGYLTENGVDSLNNATGNASSTLLAACGAARALTRSVSVLRTSLIDAGVGPPLFHLLKHQDLEVQIAATRVISNLAVDFSPMKESIIQHNVVTTLCEHCHSPNARLRFESLWALKHLVLNSTNDLKIKIVQGLGSVWIKQLLSTDPPDMPSGTVICTSKQLVSRDGLDDINTTDSLLPDRFEQGVKQKRQRVLGESDICNHTIDDDTAIQAELLDLIRNLFCGEEAAELIDYIFKELGQRDFFEIMLARLRPRTLPSVTHKDSKPIPAPTEIITKVLYVIAHIAASLPKFRDIVVQQHNLLRQILTFFNHSSREVRAQCCWVAISLTYPDDESDRIGCKRRAQRLNELGYLTKLNLMGDDTDLDVRERTKTAIELLGVHLRTPS